MLKIHVKSNQPTLLLKNYIRYERGIRTVISKAFFSTFSCLSETLNIQRRLQVDFHSSFIRDHRFLRNTFVIKKETVRTTDIRQMLRVCPFVRLQFDDTSYDIYEKMLIPLDRNVGAVDEGTSFSRENRGTKILHCQSFANGGSSMR